MGNGLDSGIQQLPLEFQIIVEEIASNSSSSFGATVIYAWGKAPGVRDPNKYRRTKAIFAVEKDSIKLVIDGGNGIFIKFWFDGDGNLRGTYETPRSIVKCLKLSRIR